MDLAIQTASLSRSFGGFRAVREVDLQVERGTFYGFLGPNGAGKSTTIKMLTGLLAPSSGRISVLGHDPLDHRQALLMKSRIGVVPEDLALFDNLTAREYLTFVGRMHSMARSLLSNRIDELLPLLDLEKDESKLTIEYSHGMKKKLALAESDADIDKMIKEVCETMKGDSRKHRVTFYYLLAEKCGKVADLA